MSPARLTLGVSQVMNYPSTNFKQDSVPSNTTTTNPIVSKIQPRPDSTGIPENTSSAQESESLDNSAKAPWGMIVDMKRRPNRSEFHFFENFLRAES